MFWIILAIAIGILTFFFAGGEEGLIAFFISALLGCVIGGALVTLSSTDRITLETQKNVHVNLDVINNTSAYTWTYNGKKYAVATDPDGADSPYRVETVSGMDKTVTLQRYVAPSNFWTFFGAKSEDTIYIINTGTLVK
jgi:hypothetical protein